MAYIKIAVLTIIILFIGIGQVFGQSIYSVDMHRNVIQVQNQNNEESSGKTNIQFEIGFNASLMNSYARGNLDTWFSERTGDPDRLVDRGSASFFELEATIFFASRDDAFQVGSGLGFILPKERSLWGTMTYFGGRQELALKPTIVSFNLPFRFQLGDASNLYMNLTPALLLGWVTGDYTDSGSGNALNFTPSPGIGFSLATKMELLTNNTFGFNLQLGYRMLNTDLVYEDSNSDTGYSQPLLNNGDEVVVDLSGLYAKGGLILRF